MKAVIEGLLFISGEDGLNIEEIAKVIGISKEETKNIINGLYNDYDNIDRGIQIEYLGNHYKLTTKDIHKEYYRKLVLNNYNNNLSESALEVLAIIAYNNPITRVDIDEIRGTNSSYAIRKLLILGLIKDEGKSTLPGKPKLYSITDKFLDCFGLKNIDELPKIEINKNKNDGENLFESRYNEKDL